MIRRLRHTLLFAVSFSLPLSAFSLFNIGAFGMTPFKLITAILLLLAAVEFTLTGRRRKPDRTTPWVLVYAVAVSLSAFQGFVRGVPAGPLIAEGTTYFSIIVFYFLVSFVASELRSLRVVMWGLAIGAAVTSIPAVLGIQEAGVGGRFTGFSGQENLLGADMAVAIPVGIALLFVTRTRFNQILLLGAVVAASGGLLASLSRTALVSGAAMWGFWVLRSGRTDTIRYLVPAALLACGMLFLAPSTVVDRMETLTDPQRRMADGSIQSRILQVEFSVKAFASSPVVGVGLRNFPMWARAQPGGRRISHVVHNAYLGVLVAQGLVGFIPYMMVLIVAWLQYSQAWRTARSRRRLRDPTLTELGTYALFLQVALFGTMVGGLANLMQKSKTMWLVVALAPVVRNLVAERIAELQGDAPDATDPVPQAGGSFDVRPGSNAAWT